MYIKKARNKLRNLIWIKKHKKVQKEYRQRFRGENRTIISHNCIGGVLSHELGLKFLSPTVNLFMSSEDFIKFCENMEYYLSLEIEAYKGDIKREYPLGQLGGLVLYFVHYETLDQARNKWNERKTRVDYDNIYIIATDRDGFTDELFEKFKKLPYENKKLFSHLPMSDEKDVVYIKGFEDKDYIEPLTNKVEKGKYLIDQFEWVEWLNGTMKGESK